MSELNPPDATIRTEREIPQSPRSIFTAFENPELLAQWWGPEGFSNSFERFDFDIGGRWVFVMHGPDGTDYPNECVFREIQPDEKIVIAHVVQPLFQLTITLAENGETTLLTWTQTFDNPEFAEKHRAFLETANQQNLDRLTAVLAAP